MKKKIIAILAIFMLLFTNYAFAYTKTSGCTLRYKRVIGGTSEKKLKDIATVKDDNTRIDARYTAKTTSISQNYANRDYTSDSSCAKINIPTSDSECNYLSTNKCYITEEDDSEFLDRYLTIKLPYEPNTTINFNDNDLYIIYKNGISYNGKKYDVKLCVNSIRRKREDESHQQGDPGSVKDNEIRLHVGRYRINGTDKEPIGFLPGVGVVGTKDAVEIDVSYIVQDSTGNEVPVNGVFIVSDIDLQQGVALENVDITRTKVYMNKDPQTNQLSNTLDYSTKTEGNKTTSYIYTTSSANLTGDHIHSYVTMTDTSRTDLTFTFDTLDAYSTMGYDTTFNNYYKIETNVINGTIDESIYNVSESDNKTINYSPKDDSYYLKRITINNEDIALVDAIKNLFTFMNINRDNTIEVEYAKKVTVQFNSKGGTSVPTQTLIPGSKAFEPAQPTRNGYTFKGWYVDEAYTTPYDFNTLVNEDKILYAKWQENEIPDANYTVRHFLEDENGTITYNGKKYKLDTSETKSAKANTNVTENSKKYDGYTAKDNTITKVVLEDGTQKLDFYYDKIQYVVTFDGKGGTPVPSQQTKKYGEKVTKPTDPTKNGYNFLYWYEIINGIEVPYDFNTPVTSNKTLIAKWQEIIPEDVYHNIRYIVDGTADNSAGNPERYKEGSTTTYTIYNPTKQGYTFSGWYNNQGLTGDKITTLNVSGKTTDITLYGKFTKNKEPYANYTVNHYLEDEDGIVSKDNRKYKLDDTKTKQAETDSTVTEKSNTYQGYVAQDNSLSGVVTEDGNLVLNFYYNKKQYNITFDSKGGTKVDNQTKKHQETVDEPENPTKDGYKFLYWYEEKDGEKVIYDFDTPVTSDKKLIAEWEEIKIIPETPKQENTISTQKTDTTIANKIIPNTGIGTAIIGTVIAIICAFFGIRYFKLRKDMK